MLQISILRKLFFLRQIFSIEFPLHCCIELSEGALLLLVAFLLVNALNCHLSLVLASVVQGDAVNCKHLAIKHYTEQQGIL